MQLYIENLPQYFSRAIIERLNTVLLSNVAIYYKYKNLLPFNITYILHFI